METKFQILKSSIFAENGMANRNLKMVKWKICVFCQSVKSFFPKSLHQSVPSSRSIYHKHTCKFQFVEMSDMYLLGVLSLVLSLLGVLGQRNPRSHKGCGGFLFRYALYMPFIAFAAGFELLHEVTKGQGFIYCRRRSPGPCQDWICRCQTVPGCRASCRMR